MKSGASRDSSELISRLKIAVEIAGSVSALAKRAGLSQPGVRRYLLGGEPSCRVLKAIAAGAGVSEDWLFSGRAAICAPQSELASRAAEVSSERLGRGLPVPRWVTLVMQTVAAKKSGAGEAQPDQSLVGELLITIGHAVEQYRRVDVSPETAEAFRSAVAATFDELRAGLAQRAQVPPPDMVSALLLVHLYRLDPDSAMKTSAREPALA